MEIGVDALELDVHLTQDNALVVMHDPTLDRTTNGTGRIAATELADIRKLDAGQGERVPLLTEVFDLVRDTPIHLCIEVKGETEALGLVIAEAIVHAVEDADFLGRVIVTSFSPAALLRTRAIQPALATMLDPSPQDGTLTPRQVCAQTLRAGANSLSFDCQFVTQALADEARLAGLTVWPWAPNTDVEIEAMVGLGITGIMTDRPDVLNKVLRDSKI
jgi:glycerophosphoryl diester phosphodiesterase